VSYACVPQSRGLFRLVSPALVCSLWQADQSWTVHKSNTLYFFVHYLRNSPSQVLA
jgi:hypothetical protein